MGGEPISTIVRTSCEIIVVAGEQPAAVDAAEQALIEANVGIYQRGETLIRPIRLKEPSPEADEIRRAAGSVLLRQVRSNWLTEQFSRAATWWRPGKISNSNPQPEPQRIDPPKSIASTYLERVGDWKVAPLVGIIQAPTLRSDGSILQEPGYDPQSALLYDPFGMEFPTISETPSREDAERALQVLERPLRGFEFADEVSRSVALAAMLTALFRNSLPTAPLFAFTAPSAGTGKSLLVDTIGIIATGHVVPVASQGANSEEDEKRLSSMLIAGDQIIHIDNCERQVGGDFLCSMLTQTSLQVRPLGRSEMIRLPQNSLVMVSGNNLELAGDVTRRAMVCRLDAEVENPETREFDFDVKEEATRDRAQLVAAGLTILKARMMSDEPCNISPLGSFERWGIVRECLIWLGREDPAKSQERLKSADPRKTELAALLAIWFEAHGENEVRLNEIAAHHNIMDSESPMRRVHDALVAMTNRPNFNTRSVGRALASNVDRIVGGLVLRARDEAGGKVYRVETTGTDKDTGRGQSYDELPF